MHTYAYIYRSAVWEIVPPVTDQSGKEIPIAQRYSPEYVATCVDITSANPMPTQGWSYSNGVFAPPA